MTQRILSELVPATTAGIVVDVAAVRGAATATSVGEAISTAAADATSKANAAQGAAEDYADGVVAAIPNATVDAKGLATAAQVSKLAGIAEGAQVNLAVGTTAGTVAAGDDSRLGTITATINGVATAVSGITASETASGVSVVAGALTIPSAQIIAAQTIPANTGTVTLWSRAVAAATDVRVEIDAVCYAGASEGVVGDRWNGTICCVAHRSGTGALAIDTQIASVPWALSEPLWDPEFDTSDNTLRLRLTSDASNDIVANLTIRVYEKSTSDAIAPAVHDLTWLRGQIEALFPIGLVAILDTRDANNVTTISGTNGKSLAATTATHFANGTLGTQTSAIDIPGEQASCLLGDMGVTITTIIVVASQAPLSAAAYQVLAGIGADGTLNALFQDNTETYLQLVAGGTIYIDNVATRTKPEDGGVHVYRLDLPGSASSIVRLGWASGGSAFAWNAPIGILLAFSTSPAADLSDLQTLATDFYAQ
jgi:hypothetical protein